MEFTVDAAILNKRFSVTISFASTSISLNTKNSNGCGVDQKDSNLYDPTRS